MKQNTSARVEKIYIRIINIYTVYIDIHLIFFIVFNTINWHKVTDL